MHLFIIPLRLCVHSPAGSDDGMVYAWSVDSGEKVSTLDGGHPGPTMSVQFNPRFMTLASACTNVVSQQPSCRVG